MSLRFLISFSISVFKMCRLSLLSLYCVALICSLPLILELYNSILSLILKYF